MSNQINNTLTNQDTQPTLNSTECVLRYISEQMEEVNFRLEAHPNKKEIKKRLQSHKNQDNNIDSNKQESDEEDATDSFNLESLLSTINLTEKIYKVFGMLKIIEKADELMNPITIHNEKIWVYNGKYWDVCSEPDFKRFLQVCFIEMGTPPATSMDVKFLNKCYEQLELASSLDFSATDIPMLNFRNGTLKFENGSNFKLQEHSKEDYLTYVLPYEYDEQADCPLFKNYLSDVIPEKDKQLVLAEFIGSIFSKLKHEKVLILYGVGHNGKSVFLEITISLLGKENVSSYTLEELTNNSNYYTGHLDSKLLNYSGEISRKINSDKFKKLASGETISARFPYGKPFEVENYARLAFNCNELPEVTESTEGFFRRFLIIPFEEYIKPKKRDPKLAQKIIEQELPGIMNWVLDGLVRLEKNEGFSDCISSEEVLEEYKKKSDTVEIFLNHINGLYKEPKLSSELYSAYQKYCSNNNLNFLGSKGFSQKLESKGVNKRRLSDGSFFDIHLF